jgi:hypothetical protein
MPEEAGILSMADAQAALTTPAEEEKPGPARDESGKFKGREAPPPAAENAQVEGDDAPEGEEVSEISAEALEAAARGEEIPTDSDTAKEPDVAFPTGWSDEEKAAFKELTPAAQKAVARLERERRADHSRHQQEHAERLKAIEADKTAAATERQNLSQALKAYANPLMAQFAAEFADLVKGEKTALAIQGEDPLRFQRLQAYQTEFNRIVGTEQALAQRAEAESTAQLQSYRAAENAKLVDMIPELKTPEARQKFDAEITGYLRDQGIPDQAIMRASAAHLAITRKAMLYDRAMKAKSSPKPVPTVQKPGVATTKAERANDTSAALLKRLDRSGDIADALALMRN